MNSEARFVGLMFAALAIEAACAVAWVLWKVIL